VVEPPEAGLKNASAILCEAVRSISTERLVTRWGPVSSTTMRRVEDALRILMRL
jgi:mRNA interferase MazF